MVVEELDEVVKGPKKLAGYLEMVNDIRSSLLCLIKEEILNKWKEMKK